MATTVVTAKFVADITDMSSKMNGLKDQLNGVSKEAEKTGKTISDRMKSAGDSMVSVGKKMSLAITAPLAGIGVAAVKTSMDFETSMSRIVGLVGLSTDEVNSMRESVLGLSGQTAKSPQELGDALFVVTSAGLKGEAAISALTAAAKASTAGLGNTSDIARSVAGSINAYGAANLDAARATDVIVATARAGNFETSQFAASIGRVLPFAKQAGASLETMGGAVALLTRTNGDAAQSVTQVAALFRAFVVPTEEAKTALADIGMSAADFREEISEKGLPAALTMLDKKLGGNREQLGRLLGSSEAASAAFQILDADAASISATFGVVQDSVEMTGEAFDAAAGTSGFKLQQAMVSLKTALIQIGDILAPVIGALAEHFKALADRFMSLPAPLKNMAVAFGVLLAAVGPVLIIGGKLMAMWVVASAKISASVLAMRAVFVSAFGSMSAAVQVSIVKIKVAMIAAQTQMGALAAGARAAAGIAVGAFRGMAVAAKGLLISLGPVGIALIAAGAAFEIFSGKSAAADQLVTTLKDSVDELTGAFGEATAAAISSQFRMDLSSEDVNALREMGISISDMTQAAMIGGPAAQAYSDKLQGLIDQHGMFSGEQDLLITTQRNFQGMSDASAEATARIAADNAARADAMAIEGKKAQAEVEKQILLSRTQAITRQQDLMNMSAAEKSAAAARIRAADAAIAKDNAMTAVTNAAKEAVTALEVAMNKLSGVIGNQNSRNAAIRSTRELSKSLKENGDAITGTSEKAMKNQDAIAASASAYLAYASATEDPIQQQKRLVKGEEAIRKALEAKGIDPNQSPIVKQFQTQLDKSEETVDEFAKRATEARALGIKTGENFINGIIEELRSGIQDVANASVAVGEAMPDGVDEGTDSSSPSKKGMQNAKNFIDGIILGLKAEKVMAKASDLARAVVSAFETEMGRVTALVEASGEAGIGFAEMVAKPFGTASQIMQNFGKDADVSSIISGVRSITDLVKQAYAPLLDQSIVGGAAAKRNRQAMNAQLGALRIMGQQAVNLRNQYDANLAEISRLEQEYGRKVDDINGHFDGLDAAAQASLDRIEKYWAGVIPGLEGALAAATDAFDRENDVLNNLVKERDSFLGRIGDGFRSFVNSLSFNSGSKTIIKETKILANGITATFEREVSSGGASSIREAFESRLQAVRDFASNIRALMARGLDPTLIQDFVSAGVDGAGEAVATLASASDSDLAAINSAQAGLASEVAAFQQYASQQWFDAGIAQQQAILAPLEAAKNAAKTALDIANSSRETELTNARAHLETLRKDREAALAAAKTSHDAEVASLTAQNLALEVEMDALAQRIDDMVTKMAMTLPPKAFAAGQKSMRQLRDGFEERFPAISSKLNQMMDNLASSMNRQATVVVTTINRTIFEGKGIDGARALGGPVMSGKTYLVGERGPELLTMGAFSGNIIPNDKIGNVPNMASLGGSGGGGGATIVNINVNVPVSANKSEIGREIVQAISQFERVSGTAWRG